MSKAHEIKAVGKSRAVLTNGPRTTRYVKALGRLLAVDDVFGKKICPNKNALLVCRAGAGFVFETTYDETCAEALARYFKEIA